jgi:lipoprotein LprG
MTVVLASCTAGNDTSPAPKPLLAAERLAAAKAKVDAAKSMRLKLRSSGIPSSVNGALGADGSGTQAPAFKGTLDARINGFQARVDVVAIDKLLYLKLPFTTGFTQIDPKQYSAPNPAQLFATEGGISSLMTATTNPVEGKKTKEGAEGLTNITGTLPGERVSKVLSIGDRSKTFNVTYAITDQSGELRRVTLVGPFYKGATSTYTLTLDNYGVPVEIKKP